MTKLVYVKPALRRHGSVAAITKAFGSGRILDMNFARDTPVEDITFS